MVLPTGYLIFSLLNIKYAFWHFSEPCWVQEAWRRRYISVTQWSYGFKGITTETYDNLGGPKNSLTRGVPSSNSSCSGVTSELKDGPLTVGPARHHKDVLRVFDGSDGSGSQHHLFPGLLEIDNVDTIITGLEDVGHHGCLGVFRSDMDRSGQHLGDVALLKFEIK